MITLLRTTSENEDFILLTEMLDQNLNDKNGEAQAKYDQYNVIQSIDTVVIVNLNKEAVGCGCFKKYDEETIEIKRMFVKPEKRGLGIASKILNELENWAIEKGFKKAILETGINQLEAISLYKKLGYNQISNYGQYINLTTSLCFTKNLIL